MLEIVAAQPLAGRSVRLTLSDGAVIERDLTDLLRGPRFDPIAADDRRFAEVGVAYGTLVWPRGVDIAPETLNGLPFPTDVARVVRSVGFRIIERSSAPVG
jgi:hypothetical protein